MFFRFRQKKKSFRLLELSFIVPILSLLSMISEAFHVRTSQLVSSVAARHVYSRLFFYSTLSTVLLAIAFGERGDTWTNVSSISDSSSSLVSKSYSGDLVSFYSASSSYSYDTYLSSYVKLSCAAEKFATKPQCIGLAGLNGISVFLRILFALTLFQMAWVWFLIAEVRSVNFLCDFAALFITYDLVYHSRHPQKRFYFCHGVKRAS